MNSGTDFIMKFAILLGLVTVLVALIPNATGKVVTCFHCYGELKNGTDSKSRWYSNCKDGKLADLQQRNCTGGCFVGHNKYTLSDGKVESFQRGCRQPGEPGHNQKIGCDKTIPSNGVTFEQYEICTCEEALCNNARDTTIDSVSPGTSLDSRRISLLAILLPCVIIAINAY